MKITKDIVSIYITKGENTNYDIFTNKIIFIKELVKNETCRVYFTMSDFIDVDKSKEEFLKLFTTLDK